MSRAWMLILVLLAGCTRAKSGKHVDIGIQYYSEEVSWSLVCCNRKGFSTRSGYA